MIRNARLLVSSFVAVACFLLSPLAARAQDAGTSAALAAAGGDGGDGGAATSTDATEADSGLAVTPFGAIEVVYAYNLREPSNGVNGFRLNDSRHATIAASNVVVGADASYGPFSARLAFQVGEMPDLYYSTADAPRWSHIQEARAGVTLGRFTGDCGIYTSPVGPESMTTNGGNNTAPGADSPNVANANISRGLLFYGLPFYHAGCRGTFNLGRGFALYAWLMNGVNAIADNNSTPSGVLNLQYASRRLAFSLLSMVGNERSIGAPEGKPLRWLFDSWLQLNPTDAFGLVAQANGGFEQNRFGWSGWVAGSLLARWHLHPRVYVAARGEYFREWLAGSSEGSASPIYWPTGAGWVGSATVTAAWRPHSNLLVRLEWRHDHAGAAIFNGDAAQDTLTAAVTAWF